MPSWNIHMAHTQRLLTRKSGRALSVENKNAFSFGCLVPDIYVGWMVPGVKHKLPYAYTHFAIPGAIPCPNELKFWNLYIGDKDRRALDSLVCKAETDNRLDAEEIVMHRRYPMKRDIDDMLLGVWAHLATDNIWNSKTREFAHEHGYKPGDQLRIAKQHDFDVFGQSLDMGCAPSCDEDLLQLARSFPQYSIEPQYVQGACEVAEKIVKGSDKTGGNESTCNNSYQIFNQRWLEITMDEVDAYLTKILITFGPGLIDIAEGNC